MYKQAIKRVFREKYHDERMAVYWGRDDETIHVIASLCTRSSARKRTPLSSLVALVIELLSR